VNSPALERERLCELLADEALWGLDPEHELEVEALQAAGHVDERFSLLMTAAIVEVSLLRPQDIQPLPSLVRLRLQASGAAWAAVTSRVVNPQGVVLSRPVVTRRVARAAVRYGPWLAAAASIGVAAIAWWPKPGDDSVAVSEKDPEKVVVQLASWKDPAGSPEAAPPVGKICWSEHCQCGYLELTGVPPNDCEHQYQLWIIDDRGMEQRISACIFDCKGGTCRVPIHPAIPVHEAQAFAITMERPGGTAVSDMSNKVAIGRCTR